ncbi:MAG: enoyl-CoA hydratase/isomerase family protein [Xanthobacteraceae bacterium]
MQKLAVRPSLAEPTLDASLARDAEAAGVYAAEIEAALRAMGPKAERVGEKRTEAEALKAGARAVKERFFRRHAVAIYDELTGHGARSLRISELVVAASARYPALLPTPERLREERALMQQSAKEGYEVDQGLFLAHVLANERCGMHLIHAMLKPKREALDRLGEFRRTGFADLGEAKVERKGKIGCVTVTNPKFLNAESDVTTVATEIAIDLVLLDDAIEVGVMRGGVVQHPKYAGRRVFDSGINLTHLYYGQISFVEFLIEREMGLMHKILRGHWRSESYDEQFEDYVEKPWLAAVETFAIGGGCQLLCVMDRVLAEPGSYFNLPASKEGFIPGAGNLRLPRLVGIKLAREGIFFERVFHAESPEGRMICDAIVPTAEMDAAIERDALRLVQAGMTSTVANRKALRVAQEPLSTYRRYMATYARQQALCLYDPRLIDNLEHNWQPGRRRL